MSIKAEEVVKKWEEASAIALDIARAVENNQPMDLAVGLVKHMIASEVAVRLTKSYAEDKIKGE